MGIRIAELFAEIGADTSKLVSGLAAAKAEIGKTGSALGGLGGVFDKLNNSTLGKTVTSMTGFQLSTLGAMAAVGKLAGAVAEAVSDYSAYAESIDHLAARTGMASEEVSRLVQVSDDFRVSQETLERAMTLALQNGFNPTIDNLAALADRYNAIQDPTQRAAEMQDIFGRSWADLVPLLERGGDAIKEASAGISDSLIVTSEAIRMNREYQASLDDLGDAWTGVKNEAGKGLIPSATVFAKDMQMLMAGASLWEVLAYNQEEYRKIEERATSTEKLHTMALERSAESTRLSAMAAAYQKKQLEESAAATAQAAKVADAYTARLYAASAAHNDNVQKMQAAQVELDKYNAMVEQQPALLQAWQDAQTNYNATMQQFSQGYAQDAAGALEAAGVSGEKLEAALGALDEQNGTTLLGQYKANAAMEDAARKYQTGEYDLQEYTAALAENKTEWELLDDNVQSAKSALEEAKGAFDALMMDMASWNGKTFRIEMITGVGGGQAGTGGGVGAQETTYGIDLNGNGIIGAKNGANFVVPPGYPNDSFPMRVSSGEHVEVTPAGKSPGSTINIGTIVLPNVKNPNDFIKAMRTGAISGAGFAGG